MSCEKVDEDGFTEQRRNRWSPCCYYLSFSFTFLVILVILGLVVVLIIYIVFQPRLPKYSLQDVAIKQLNVTNNRALNAKIALTILVENPNAKVGIHYRKLQASVWYQGTAYAECVVAPFYQASRTSSSVVADLQATSAPLSRHQRMGIQAAIGNNDVPLLARINVGAGLEIISGWVFPPVHVLVACDIRVSNSSLLTKSCKWQH